MSTESRRIRVLLADDHSIMREGLESMLKDSEEFEVVGSARDGVEAVRAASELSPDVIVMDVMMPKKSSGPHHQDSGEAKIRESTAGVSRKPSSDGKAGGSSSKHLCGLTAWNT